MTESPAIAVLLTCHNRRRATLACLESLSRSLSHAAVSAAIYLVDDGSTDGTAAAVMTAFPTVQVLHGTGSLYWCGGMRLAWDTAATCRPSTYLWLNDDVVLDLEAVTALLKTLERQRAETGRAGVVVGSTRDPLTAATSYGGFSRNRRVEPQATPQAITTFNGNIVLVSRAAAETLGNLSPVFSHAMADIEYGHRAGRRGIPVWLAPGHLGTCAPHDRPRWLDDRLSLRDRLRILHAPTGCPPDELIRLMLVERKWWFPASVLRLYLSALFPPRQRSPDGTAAAAREAEKASTS